MEDLPHQQTLCVLIDSYDGFKLKENETLWIHKCIEETIKTYAIYITANRNYVTKLNKEEKEKLAFIISSFFKTISKKEFEKIYSKADSYKKRNTLKHLFNHLFHKPINQILSTGISIGSDAICRSLGLPPIDNKNLYREYISELKIEKTKTNQDRFKNAKYSELKKVFEDLLAIIKTSGFKNTVLFFDKIDEHRRLDGNITKVVEFVSGIIKDTNLLQNRDASFVFIIWSRVKNELNKKGVRFDKFKPVDVSWSSQEIHNIVNLRLTYFCLKSGIRPFKIEDAIKKEQLRSSVLEIANCSPRDLLRLLSFIHDLQQEKVRSFDYFENNSIEQGIESFVSEYDYYSLYPVKNSNKENIYNVIGKILAVGKAIFEFQDLGNVTRTKKQTTMSHLKIMLSYGLIAELPKSNHKNRTYKVLDPKIKWMIKSKTKIISSEIRG